MITTALLIGICVPLVSIIAGLLIARCMRISEDTDDDAAIAQIKQASEPMTREVRRVRGLS